MAKLPAFLNHVDNEAAQDYTDVTVTSADADHPASNLQLLPITTVWRSADGALSAVDIKLDFGSAKSINLIGLVNHNLSSAATITVDAGTTTSYANYSATMTWREFNAFLWISTAQSYRHWRIRITDSANLDNYIEVGYVVAGSATELTKAFAYEWRQIDDYVNQEVASEFGIPTVTEMFYRMRFQFTFMNNTTTQIAAVRTIFQDAKLNVNPLFFIPDTGTNDGYFGRFMRPFERIVGIQESASMEFIEDGRGKKIAA